MPLPSADPGARADRAFHAEFPTWLNFRGRGGVAQITVVPQFSPALRAVRCWGQGRKENTFVK